MNQNLNKIAAAKLRSMVKRELAETQENLDRAKFEMSKECSGSTTCADILADLEREYLAATVAKSFVEDILHDYGL